MFRKSPEKFRKDVEPWRFSTTRLQDVLMRQQIYLSDLNLQFFAINKKR